MSDKAKTVVEATVISLANKTTATAGLTGFIGWLSQINWLGLIGSMVAITGLVISTYYQWKKDKRETELHQEKLKMLYRRSEIE